ncbi:MAG: phosphoheptose isomerase [Bacteroidetes bacterium GWA2_31_9]|nr:MAG: phosphoheptose isomerase [Bacteroidetes bacterium GWA2_31_9]
MTIDTIISELNNSKLLLDNFLSDSDNFKKIEKAGDLIAEAINNGNKIISCGNGGSMSDAMHFAEEMTGNFRKKRRPLPAIAISDPAYLTCVANDYGFAHIFSRWIECFGNKGDVLLAISTSGNSENIIKAVETALEKGMLVIGLTGKNGGKLAELSTVEIRAPFYEFSDRTQEIHIKIIHSLIQYVELKLNL